ncbi:MAG TPA: DUF4199 domain-containing protein [Flavobacteriales bacterium]|nr:DUF4199 domain-containing protein [Flavobacteriales bacterium]
MKRIILTYGLIGGIIVSAMMWLTLGDGNHDWENGEMIGYTTMVIALSTIFFGVKAHRDKNLAGSITFGKAFLTGLYITLIASTLYVATWLVISANMEKDFMESYIEHTQAKLVERGTPEVEVQTKVQEMRAMGELYKNPVVKVGFTYMEILPVGLLISLVCAGVLKRRSASSSVR